MATRFADHLLTGTHASRPAATAVPEGTLYACTDHSLVYQSDGATWATWATLGTAGGIAAGLLDAKGDLIAASAADTAARLAVGTDGFVLVADSAQSAGLKWAAPGTLALNAQTGTTYTLVLGDAGKLVTLSNASAITLTVPPNSSVAFPTGTSVLLAQIGAGQVTVAPGSGVTVSSRGAALKLNGQYAEAALIKTATDTWILSGDITT